MVWDHADGEVPTIIEMVTRIVPNPRYLSSKTFLIHCLRESLEHLELKESTVLMLNTRETPRDFDPATSIKNARQARGARIDSRDFLI